MSTELLVILLAITTFTLTIQCFIVFQQLCITNIADRIRLYRILMISLYTTLSIMGNILMYLSALYPDYTIASLATNISTIQIIIEAISICIGFHLFRIFNIQTSHKIYAPTNTYPPKWIIRIFICSECVSDVTVVSCYALHFVFSDIDFIHIFYIFLSVVIIIQTPLIYFAASRVFKSLNTATRIQSIIVVPSENCSMSSKHTKLQSAKQKMKCSMIVALFIIFAGFLVLFLNVATVLNEQNYNETLDDIMHAILPFLFITVLIFWLYQDSKCCSVPRNSICELFEDCMGCSCGYDDDDEQLNNIHNRYIFIMDKEKSVDTNNAELPTNSSVNSSQSTTRVN
eukprot:234158_1